MKGNIHIQKSSVYTKYHNNSKYTANINVKKYSFTMHMFNIVQPVDMQNLVEGSDMFIPILNPALLNKICLNYCCICNLNLNDLCS